NRQRASVARPHEVDLAELQRLADTLDFLDVVRDRVEGRAPRPFGFPATELVDQDDAIPELGQVLERQQIVVGGPRPSVQAWDGPFRRPSVRTIEQIEAENLDVALGGFHAPDARRGIRASTDDCLGRDDRPGARRDHSAGKPSSSVIGSPAGSRSYRSASNRSATSVRQKSPTATARAASSISIRSMLAMGGTFFTR